MERKSKRKIERKIEKHLHNDVASLVGQYDDRETQCVNCGQNLQGSVIPELKKYYLFKIIINMIIILMIYVMVNVFITINTLIQNMENLA